MSFKEKNVVMLPTNEKASIIGLHEDTKRLVFNNPNNKDIPRGISQHLYFLSDEEIKEGDYVYYECDNAIFRCKHPNLIGVGEYKVIATTDSSLRIPDPRHPNVLPDWNLPQPSPSFIQKFIEEYNAGRPITKVMVEYEKIITDTKHYMLTNECKGFDEKLKVNPKDNTITIIRVKNTYTQEEVDDLLDRQAAKTTAQVLSNLQKNSEEKSTTLIHEQLISYKTAKLAKEKGFNELTREYDQHGNGVSGRVSGKLDFYNKKGDFYISVPTQSLLQKWLRDLHKIMVVVNFWNDEGYRWEDNRYIVTVDELKHFKTYSTFVKDNFTSYEEALEEGLLQALNLIK